ncbi:hypothetical protein [Candidatus Uabimicrobium amorphum]|uniref:Uncharacterized protein n=1 Tax=Uabimicrobium amorphum TaxID=2596890 RepID=A0A5S9F6B0_UABAM|nr:hypothetical protein [Candidatus Uabimicrobium amorphum]BBM86469.1 hypothetical protein UABAM_04855 [Candidatus Uabimicrobium amorphum]
MTGKVKTCTIVVTAILITLFTMFSFGYYKAKMDIYKKIPNIKEIQYHGISAFSTKIYGGGCDVWFEYSYLSFAFQVKTTSKKPFVCEWILTKKGPKIIYGGWAVSVGN